jgi:hypothetical protein
MLIDTNYGILNVFLEPQFLSIGSEPLYTIQASDFRSFRSLELPAFVEFRMDPRDLLFPYTGFAYSWHLEHLISSEKLCLVPALPLNANPEPSAYCWEASMTAFDAEIEEGADYEWGDIRVGFCLRDELADDKNSQPLATEWFRAYPLYRLPTYEELSTLWVSQGNED